MAKCLIAGLPGAGKSTYIGALAYSLQNPSENQILSYADNPEDMSYLNKLSDPWLSLKRVDRTAMGMVNNVDLRLVRNTDAKKFQLTMPDIAGEDFISVLQKQSDLIKDWSEQADSLLFFINRWETNVLAETMGYMEPLNKTKEPPLFTASQMSVEVQNVLLLKQLHNLFQFKKIAICLSSWDKYVNDYSTPLDLLDERAKFLSNFLRHYFPNVDLYGVSAQGAEYSDNETQVEELMQKTMNGLRAYVVTSSGNKFYDLSLPLINLLEE